MNRISRVIGTMYDQSAPGDDRAMARRAYHLYADSKLLKLRTRAASVLSTLLCELEETEDCCIEQFEIAIMIDCTERTAQRAIKQIKEEGLISASRKNRNAPNRYTLTAPDDYKCGRLSRVDLDQMYSANSGDELENWVLEKDFGSIFAFDTSSIGRGIATLANAG